MRSLVMLLFMVACRSPAEAPKVNRGLAMLEVQQSLAGRDFATGSAFAQQMANFVYVVVDRQAGECVLVDPAWDVQGLLDIVARQNLKLVGVVATHAHWDHVGGRFSSQDVEGIARLVSLKKVPVWAHQADAGRIRKDTGIDEALLRAVADGEKVKVGNGEIQLMHTPGHTPGSQCVRVGEAIITGDTLFVGECGRVDLAGSDPAKMFASLQKLAALPEGTVVYPGHNYGATPTTTIGDERRTSPCMKPRTLEAFKAWLAEP